MELYQNRDEDVPDHNSHTLEEYSYRQLRKAIASGELAPGSKLVGSQLATTLHVSRLTVANALKRLISEGFVTGAPHREAVVASLDEKGLHEIFLMRHALEDVVMQAVADHTTPALLARLYELNEQLYTSIDQQNAETYRRIEREYHLLIYSASELPMITALLTDLWDRLEPYRGRRYSHLYLNNDAHREHLSIHQALLAGDGNLLATTMREHVHQGYERFLEALTLPTTGKSLLTNRQQRKTQKNQSAPGSLRSAFEALPDKRGTQGKMHAQSAVLALATCAMLCGVRSRYGIAQWNQRCHSALRVILGFSAQQGPSIATIQRIFHDLDQDAFKQILLQWFTDHGILFTTDGPAETIEQEESLPATELIAHVTRCLQPVLSQSTHSQEGAMSPPAWHQLAKLPTFLLTGQEITADALVAQRELVQQIIHAPG